MDLTTLIIDLLRKKEETAALNAGGQTLAPPAQPTPEMLGSGMASEAAKKLLQRKSEPMKYVDSL